MIGRVRVLERVILLRLQDVRDDALELIEQHGGDAWDMMCLDYGDAFKRGKVHVSEYKHMAGKAVKLKPKTERRSWKPPFKI